MLIRQGGRLEPFSFGERRYLKRIYDTPSKRVLLKFGRQSEKSTTLGNKALAFCCIQPGFRVLYVSPTNTQTREFSKDRLKEPIETCPMIAAYTDNKLSMNVLSKQFINRSQITLRYAFLNADRVRGIATDFIMIDEIQDILMELVPVVEECAAHSEYKLFSYSGTPKTFDNALEYHWQLYSTQNEWVVPCYKHQIADPSTNRLLPYFNILSEKNIGKHGPICDRCGAPIRPDDPGAQWASLRPNPDVPHPFEGFHISQIMVPWIWRSEEGWKDILHKQRTYGRQKFFNEVLGESYDSGIRPLTREDIERCCAKEGVMDMSLFDMSESALEKWRQLSQAGTQVFAGIDWGSGENSYTVLSLAAYHQGRFTIFYVHRFTGPDVEPVPQMDKICNIISRFNVALGGTDYGGGFDRNDTLIRRFGHQKILKYQYSGTKGKICDWDPTQHRYKGNRTAMLSAVFNTIKRELFWFPRWQVFEDHFARDLLNVFSEYNEKMRMTVYNHSPGTTDDTLHSITLAFFVSMIMNPRPDVLAPTQERG